MEPGALQTIAVVENRALQLLGAGRIDNHGDGAELLHDVVIGAIGIEEHFVAEP